MSIAVKRIKAILTDSDISIRKLGVLTGIPPATISRYIGTETQKMPLDKLELIASALNVTPSYLMGWEDGNVYHCPDDENPYELELCDAFSKYNVDSQRVIAKNLSDLARFQISPV